MSRLNASLGPIAEGRGRVVAVCDRLSFSRGRRTDHGTGNGRLVLRSQSVISKKGAPADRAPIKVTVRDLELAGTGEARWRRPRSFSCAPPRARPRRWQESPQWPRTACHRARRGAEDQLCCPEAPPETADQAASPDRIRRQGAGMRLRLLHGNMNANPKSLRYGD